MLLINGHEKMFCFEYVPNDPLYSILESAIKIIGNAESTIIFHNGSQKEFIAIKKVGDSSCRIETGTVYLDLPVKQFCKAVLRMFDTYVFAFSRDEYTDNWYTFPESDLERLRVLYHSL